MNAKPFARCLTDLWAVLKFGNVGVWKSAGITIFERKIVHADENLSNDICGDFSCLAGNGVLPLVGGQMRPRTELRLLLHAPRVFSG